MFVTYRYIWHNYVRVQLSMIWCSIPDMYMNVLLQRKTKMHRKLNVIWNNCIGNQRESVEYITWSVKYYSQRNKKRYYYITTKIPSIYSLYTLVVVLQLIVVSRISGEKNKIWADWPDPLKLDEFIPKSWESCTVKLCRLILL